MNYSLGNMLSRGGSLNADGLSLDLQFATDKTLVARRGPTPTFTRASTATFVGSDGLIQSAAINQARFDHDPVTLASSGLLIEESRTNLITQSANISAWSGGFTNNGSTTAPDGTSSGYSAVIGFAACQSPITANATGLHTASCFLKRNNTDWIRIRVIQGTGLNTVIAWVNLATGVVGTLSATAGTPTSLSATIISYGNGWYRCSVTASYPATSYIYISLASATGDGIFVGVAGSIFEVWGGQIEAGAFPTSYIPTTTASVVRSADVCSITGSDFTGFTKLGEGTVVVHGDSYQGTTPAFCQFSNDTNGARSFNFQRNTSTGALEYSDSSSGVLTVAASPSYPVKFGAARDQAAGVRLVYNGIIGTGSAFTTNNPQTRMLIGNSSIGLPLNGCIRSIKHFKKKLSNAKLVTLTT